MMCSVYDSHSEGFHCSSSNNQPPTGGVCPALFGFVFSTRPCVGQNFKRLHQCGEWPSDLSQWKIMSPRDGLWVSTRCGDGACLSVIGSGTGATVSFLCWSWKVHPSIAVWPRFSLLIDGSTLNCRSLKGDNPVAVTPWTQGADLQ